MRKCAVEMHFLPDALALIANICLVKHHDGGYNSYRAQDRATSDMKVVRLCVAQVETALKPVERRNRSR